MKSLTEDQLHEMMEKVWLKGAMEYYNDFNYDREDHPKYPFEHTLIARREFFQKLIDEV